MNIFIDTAVHGCNIALFDDGKIIDSLSEPVERGHAETFLPCVESLIQNNNKASQDIENIYVTIGPGSFTGLRVGLTVAQFMGFSLKKPVYGITTFQAFSCGVNDDQNRMVLVETKRTDFYTQLMNVNHEPIGQPCVLSADQIHIDSDVIVTGDAVDRFISETGYSEQGINQTMINPAAVINAIQSDKLKIHPAQPFYIRDADVSKPKTGKR